MFKTVIKVKLFDEACKFEVSKKGDWIDLHSRIDFHIEKNKFKLLPFGVAMELPDGYEAIIASRSSTYIRNFIANPNAIGIIDNSYHGDNDEWKWLLYAYKEQDIKKGDRFCQFRIQLSQKATFWQKIKWLFSNKIEFKFVDELGNNNRGGFGSTGVR